MDKNTFKQEIKDYTARGGKFAFVFGDIRLPVIYHEALNMLAVKMPAHEVFVPVDYSRDLGDNLDVLMNKLLEKYPAVRLLSMAVAKDYLLLLSFGQLV